MELRAEHNSFIRRRHNGLYGKDLEGEFDGGVHPI